MLINELPKLMLRSLICTIIIELVVSIILGIRNKKDILNVILVNIITNPLVAVIPVYFNFFYSLKMRNIALIILEILTLIFEGYIYKKYLNFKKLNPFLISLILNCGSYFIGEVINRFL